MLLDPNPMDRSITDAVIDHRSPFATDLAQIITATGNTLVLAVLATLVVISLAVRGWRAEAVMVGVGSILGYAVMVSLKQLFGRPRPPVSDRLLDIETYSFPSGHAMMSMVVFGLIAVAAHRTSSWVRAHPVVLVLAPLWSIAIGCTRVYLGVHWATDVIAGWVIGAVWVALCAWLCGRWAPVERVAAGSGA
ncbi:phosphatase PAP2 family protein [Gordonia sp. PKS22-38]|uniref:Phosphatase PAP2 family protein n=1 Tax=Gordonia prachuapensis TaxID=3115651 RepID=A0ABU7MZ71_9ACTN|nr:phosphatase PAP2 family protein [Gordonia sp. PKS22-38]